MPPSVRSAFPMLGIVVAVVVALGAAAWFGRPATVSGALIDDVSVTAPADDTVPVGGVAVVGSGAPTRSVLTVHVSGAVAAPGLVSLAPGSRVADALAAAGGALATGEVGRLNLAASVADGEHIVVPSVTDPSPVVPAASDPQDAGSGPVHLNTATPEELETLPGVGPVLAGRIIDHRERDGPFTVPEDLLDVSGIGEARLESLRDLVAVP